jgi:hypothetical protein
MRELAVVHDETVALVADAVTQLTRRAVEPTLEPFKSELNKLNKRLQARVDDIDSKLRADELRAREIVSALADMTTALDTVQERLTQVELASMATARQVGADLHFSHEHTSSALARLEEAVASSRRTARKLAVATSLALAVIMVTEVALLLR